MFPTHLFALTDRMNCPMFSTLTFMFYVVQQGASTQEIRTSRENLVKINSAADSESGPVYAA